MPYADELASSDPADEAGAEPLPTADDPTIDPASNLDLNYGHTRQSSMAPSMCSRSPSIGSATSSSLGRRPREIGPGYFSNREKVHIREFTQEKCTEYELPPKERAIIMKNSEVRFIISISSFQSY